MPIPVYEQRTRASHAGLGPGPMDGRGIQALSAAIGQVGDVLLEERLIERRKAEADAISEAHLTATRASAEWSQQLAERSRNAAAGAAGFTPAFEKDFDAYRSKVEATAKTPQARAYLKERFEALRGDLSSRAMAFEAEAGIRHRGQQMVDAVDQARIAIRANPEDFETQLVSHAAALDAASLPAETRAKLWADAREGMAASAVESLVERDPRGTLKALQSAPGKSGVAAIEALSADSRERARSAAEGEIRRREIEARAAAAEARDGLREAEADAFAAKASGMDAVLPPRSSYVAAYGAEGAKRYEQASKLFSVYDVASAAAALPPAEGAAMISAYRPTQQAGAAAAADVQSAAVKLYTQQRKALEDDPAAGIMVRDPSIATLFNEAMDGDAEAAQQYVAQVRARSQAMGLPVALLPKASSEALAASLTFNPENPRQRSETIQALRQQWGRHFPQVVREIAPKLEPDARIVANMAPEDARRYDAVVGQGRTQVMAQLDSGTKSKVQSASREAVQPLLETLLSNQDAEARVAEHLDAVQIMAASLVVRGAAPNEAAAQAFDMVIGKRYTFRDSLRIPKALDADDVVRRADLARNSIKPATLAVQPMAFSTEAQAQEALASRIAREGEWFTTADDGGIELRVPIEGRGLVPVVTKDGKRVRYTWAQLQERQFGARGQDLRPYEEGAR